MLVLRPYEILAVTLFGVQFIGEKAEQLTAFIPESHKDIFHTITFPHVNVGIEYEMATNFLYGQWEFEYIRQPIG